MFTILQTNVPRCPKCSAMMFKREQDNRLFMICADCLKVYEIVDTGQSEMEMKISDNEEETIE